MANTKRDPRMSQSKINKLLLNNQSGQTQTVQLQPPAHNITFGGDNPDCDTLNAAEQIRQFRSFLSDVISRYEGNVAQQTDAEQEETDLSHAIELADHLTDKEKRMLFRKLRATLQVRRACKTENEILQPIYDFAKNNQQFYNTLGTIQGQVSTKKEVAMARRYACRTPILDGFRQE